MYCYMYILTRVWDKKSSDWYTHSAMQGHPCFACNCARAVEHTCGIRCTCIHILMCGKILTNVWDH